MIELTDPDRNSEYRPPKNLFKRSSKAWYLLPIFFSIIGGMISYFLLRNKDPRLARNTLLVGAGLFVVFIVLVTMSGTSDDPEEPETISDVFTDADKQEIATISQITMSSTEIKDESVRVPYEQLVQHSDAYAGDIIQYTGHVIGVLNKGEGSYVLKVEVYDIDDRFLAQDRLIWSKYTPNTPEELSLVKYISQNSNLFAFADSKNAVKIWAVHNGLRDFEIVFDTYKIPETEILLLEMLVGKSTDTADSGQRQLVHKIAYSDIPEYVDSTVIMAAMNDAIREWEDDNPSTSFEIVSDNADVDIMWSHFMPKHYLGAYSSYNLTSGDGTVTKHKIDILMGIDDCKGNYQQFSHDSLKYTIAHEIGHYLGLGHVDEPDNLMYSDGFIDYTDNIFSYQTFGYKIPYIDRGEHMFMATEVLLVQSTELESKISELANERIYLKETNQDTAQLEINKEKINSLTQELSDLEETKNCIREPQTFWEALSNTS